MKTQQLKKEILKEFKLSLNPVSKFYSEDLHFFNGRLKSENNKEKLIRQLGNLRCLNGKSRTYNVKVKQITNELSRGGMFNVKNMKYGNALD